jgi:hypothetical protein
MSAGAWFAVTLCELAGSRMGSEPSLMPRYVTCPTSLEHIGNHPVIVGKLSVRRKKAGSQSGGA